MTHDDLYWKALYKFLRQNNCLERFLYNVKADGGWLTKEIHTKSTKDNIIECLKKCGGINCAFIWVRTQEGENFWRQLNENFKNFYKRITEDYDKLKL